MLFSSFKTSRIAGVIRRLGPQSIKDFDAFLDQLPVRAGIQPLLGAALAWIVAMFFAFLAVTQIEKVSSLRAELTKVEALKPPVPVLVYTPVPASALSEIHTKISHVYAGLSFTGSPDSFRITAADTDYFPQFLAALATLQYGGQNWRVTLNSLCVGRDCVAAKLFADIKVQSARIDEDK